MTVSPTGSLAGSPTSSTLTSRVPTSRMRPRRDPDWMVRQLPVGMTSEDFFVRFVRIFQELGTTLLEDADNVDHVADVTVAPPAMVRWLASWIGLRPLDESLPEELQRRIVASAARTIAWRGTSYGLRTYLGLITGAAVRVEEGGGVWPAGEAPHDTAWVKVHLDTSGLLAEAEIVEVVRDEVPAHTRAELYVGGRLVWSSEVSPLLDPEDHQP